MPTCKQHRVRFCSAAGNPIPFMLTGVFAAHRQAMKFAPKTKTKGRTGNIDFAVNNSVLPGMHGVSTNTARTRKTKRVQSITSAPTARCRFAHTLQHGKNCMHSFRSDRKRTTLFRKDLCYTSCYISYSYNYRKVT